MPLVSAAKMPRSVGSYVTASIRGVDRRRSADAEVAANLPADLLPLWEQVARRFSGSPDERAEAFMEYAHDHASEVVAAIQNDADAKLDAMIDEFERRVA